MHIPGTPRTRAVLAATATAALVISTPLAAVAKTVDEDALTPHTHFVMQPDGSSGSTTDGESIPNIDSVKSTIRTYYGSPLTGPDVGKSNKTDSPYIREMATIEGAALAGLPTVDPAANKAIVFDADDTTLWTYDMEDAAMHFNFDPKLQNEEWVQKAKFPATPGMVDFVKAVEAKGYHVYGITGRSSDQEEATLTNLTNEGYTGFDADNFYTKWTVQPGSASSPLPQPAYVDCAADGDASKCSTVEYKAFTRKHIEDADGMDIVLNIGDQWSDLQGGYADDTLKLPNPTYFLPSADLDGTAADPEFSPRTEFDMAADGSSGTAEDGEGIPNIDSVKSTIRTYYGAVNGIANKDSSPYIEEMSTFSHTWAKTLRHSCLKGHQRGVRPAVVFDADDTTLWTYDMEDGNPADDGMQFNFNPTLQDQKWVQPERFPATPGMKRVVRAAAQGGCKIVGLTGRGATQREATLGNLAKFYYDKKTDSSLFKPQYYFTKWAGATPPSYVNCAMDADATKCSTIEYKSSTRKYVEDHFGFHIIANFGDQFSDLKGGSSDRAVKLPNPTYYLP
jgi:predicted secreted acid phosphatase